MIPAMGYHEDRARAQAERERRYGAQRAAASAAAAWLGVDRAAANSELARMAREAAERRNKA